MSLEAGKTIDQKPDTGPERRIWPFIHLLFTEAWSEMASVAVSKPLLKKREQRGKAEITQKFNHSDVLQSTWTTIPEDYRRKLSNRIQAVWILYMLTKAR